MLKGCSDTKIIALPYYRVNHNKRPCSNMRPCQFSDNNIILTCMNSCLIDCMIEFFDMESALKEKKVAAKEKLLPFKSLPLLKRVAESELLPL